MSVLAPLGVKERTCSKCPRRAVMHEPTCFECGDWTANLNNRRYGRKYYETELEGEERRAYHRQWMRDWRARKKA